LPTITKHQVLSATDKAINDILNDDHNFTCRRFLEAVEAYMQILDMPDAVEVDLAPALANENCRPSDCAATK
jgi:hypothetical protein